MHAHFSGYMGQDFVSIFQSYFKDSIGKRFQHSCIHSYGFIFCHYTTRYPEKLRGKYGIKPKINFVLCGAGEHIRTVFGDGQGVLKMGRGFTISGNDGPAVGHYFYFVAAQCNHGLYRQDHTLSQYYIIF